MRLFKRRIEIGTIRWRYVCGTWTPKGYHKKCKLLKEAGLDYRVWMEEDESHKIIREAFGGEPADDQIYYSFYVKKCDFKEACRVLHVDPRNENRIDAIY